MQRRAQQPRLRFFSPLPSSLEPLRSDFERCEEDVRGNREENEGRERPGYSARVPKRIFTYEEAVALLPDVQRITAEAVERARALGEEETEEAQAVLTEWADEIMSLGIEVKGLWLIDFDSGSGYYCWKYPEASLQFFHGYEEGFGGRVGLN
jgi:hypothetical protein